MRHRPQVVFIPFVLMAFVAATVLGEELPSLSVELSSGKKLKAILDSKTSTDRLWLRFGGPSTLVRRGFDWQTIAAVREGEQPRSRQELIQVAAAARQLKTTGSHQQIVIAPSDSNSSFPVRSEQWESRKPLPVAAVTFDAMLGNWDADVATDGLFVQVRPVDFDGEPVTVQGVLTVELFSIHRVDQNSIAHGRGRDIRMVGQWTAQISCEPGNPSGGWVRLPFQSANPEFDVDWAPYGLVHVQFAAAGHGVFNSSIDGLRIRPYAPLRDTLQQKSESRFLPSELH